MKLLYAIGYIALLMSLSTALSGCGDCYSPVVGTNGPLPVNMQAQPVCDLGPITFCYDRCLRNNSNLYGSPAWFYFIEQCKLRWFPNPYNPNVSQPLSRS